MLFELSPKKAVINDYNEELMNVFNCIKDETKFNKMCNELNHHEANHSEEYYYEIRNKARDKAMKVQDYYVTLFLSDFLMYANAPEDIIYFDK